MSWNNISEDPHGCINVGDMIDNGLTEVVGFSAPSGKEPKRLMVKIKYQDGSITTRNYANVLVQKIKGQIITHNAELRLAADEL